VCLVLFFKWVLALMLNLLRMNTHPWRVGTAGGRGHCFFHSVAKEMERLEIEIPENSFGPSMTRTTAMKRVRAMFADALKDSYYVPLQCWLKGSSSTLAL
jgi:hypothetical protein